MRRRVCLCLLFPFLCRLRELWTFDIRGSSSGFRVSRLRVASGVLVLALICIPRKSWSHVNKFKTIELLLYSRCLWEMDYILFKYNIEERAV